MEKTFKTRQHHFLIRTFNEECLQTDKGYVLEKYTINITMQKTEIRNKTKRHSSLLLQQVLYWKEKLGKKGIMNKSTEIKKEAVVP